MKKSGLRAKIETRKQLHTVFILIVEQLMSYFAIVQSYWRESLLILTSFNNHVMLHDSLFSFKHKQNYVPIVNYRILL